MIASTAFSSSLPAAPTVQTYPRSSASSIEADEDAALVGRFVQGDDAAFSAIMDRYRRRMWSVAYRVLRNHADAEEVAQDTFLRAHRGLAQFRGECSLSTWLHRIALNLARNRYWYFFRRQRHAAMSLEMPLGSDNPVSLGELIASDEMGPVREANAAEFTQLVHRCMAGLTEESSEILVLRCQGNQSYAEISRALGLSVGTVKSRLSRARERLRAAMLQACPEFAEGDASGEWFDAVRPAIGHGNLSP